MNAHYPSDYPDGFEEKLIAAGAKTQTITPVYRILYDGKLNAFNFESTYINYRRRHKKEVTALGDIFDFLLCGTR